MRTSRGRRAATLIAAGVLALAGCGKGADATGGAAPSASAAGAHTGRHATPGSHEDWCEEHAVPESLCTRCNPALVPAFKASGDWCAEHGLPESQCLRCNPQLKIVRPPAKAGG